MTPMTREEFAALFPQLEGRELRGGCPDCAATHRYVPDMDGDEVVGWHILVSHSDTCPALTHEDEKR